MPSTMFFSHKMSLETLDKTVECPHSLISIPSIFIYQAVLLHRFQMSISIHIGQYKTSHTTEFNFGAPTLRPPKLIESEQL